MSSKMTSISTTRPIPRWGRTPKSSCDPMATQLPLGNGVAVHFVRAVGKAQVRAPGVGEARGSRR